LLVSFNWPEKSERYIKVARFVDAFFSKIGEFAKPPRHPKWKESSIIATIPGWQRFKPAEDWLLAHDMAPEKVRFEKFLADNPALGGADLQSARPCSVSFWNGGGAILPVSTAPGDHRQPTGYECALDALKAEVSRHGLSRRCKRQSFQRSCWASAILRRPASVLGPVHRPPWFRQRPFG
jgi:hypothetical protein